MLVHGEQAIEVFGPIPAEGTVRSTGRIANIWDKRSGAVVVMESESVDAVTGELRFRTRMAAFIRGEGGFGGERGPSGPRNEPPARAPDLEIRYQTRPDQALLYRLSGDRNPLHSDPEFAKLAGFEKPILHGLCSYGFTGRALLHGLCGGRSRALPLDGGALLEAGAARATRSRSRSGSTGGEALFRTSTQRGDVVIDQGRFTFAS